MSNLPNPCETWIPYTQAAALMDISPSTVVRRINEGKLQGKQSTDFPFDSNGKTNYLVLLEHLPPKAQHRYHLQQMASSETIAIDIVSPKETYGDLWLKKFIDLSSLLAEVASIRREYRSSRIITERLTALANSHGISLRTLYRYEGKRDLSDISKLWLDPVYLSKHIPQSMCLLSCDFAYYLWLSPQHYSQNDILRELKSLAGKVSCAECVYCETNAEHKNFVQKISYPLPICRLASEFMRIPSTRYPLNNLLSHIPSQQVCFCREGFRSWNAKYGHFIIRDKPMLVNLNWQGDHHVFDCFVRVKQMRTENSIRQEREVLVRPVLTAWMDTASGCIVGWVISIIPNASIIAEAFCRAVVYTYGDSFHGLPSSILVDCGKDYRSALLEDIPVDMENSFPEDSFLNRHFSGMGILPALNVSVYHALPYHPQSKSIERLFGTLENRWISKLPGWCHNSVAERPQDFQEKLKQQWKNHELFSLEEFVNFFRTKVLPEYHGNFMDSETSEPGEWHTARESLSPLELYHTLPKARDLTPDWRTMSILKMQRKNDRKVHRQGILFCGRYYWHDALAWYIGDQVDLLYNTPACKEDSPLSLTVIHQGTFICEAEPAKHYDFVDEESNDLQAVFDEKNHHVMELKATYTRLSHILDTVGLSSKESFRREAYTAVVDAERDSTFATDLSADVISGMDTEELENIQSGKRKPDAVCETASGGISETPITFSTDEFQKTNRLLFGEE